MKSLTEPIDTSTDSAFGQFQLQLFGAFAQLERGLIRERTRAGLEAARARGRTGGRPAAITPKKLKVALALLEQGELTMPEISAQVGVGRSTLNRYLARHRAENASASIPAAKPGRPSHRDIRERRCASANQPRTCMALAEMQAGHPHRPEVRKRRGPSTLRVRGDPTQGQHRQDWSTTRLVPTGPANRHREAESRRSPRRWLRRCILPSRGRRRAWRRALS